MVSKRISLVVVAVASLVAVGCFKPAPVKALASESIPFKMALKDAYATSLRDVVKADLSVEMKDADAGIVKTEWHASGKEVVGLGTTIEHRARFVLVLQDGVCNVKPESQIREQLTAGDPWSDWGPAKGSNALEEEVFTRLVQTLRTDLAAGSSASAAAPAAASSPAPAK